MSSMDLELKNKKALITASSKGLGKAAALALAKEGVNLALCSRSELIQQTAAEIREETGSQVLAYQADLTVQEDIVQLVRRTLDELGGIDILVINAGGPPPGNFLSLTLDDWRAAVDLTLLSVVSLCYEVVPHMLDKKSGVILASQSFTVKQPLDNLILSNSLRMAVIGLMKSLANELGPSGIRVNSINPGWTQTERVTQLMEDRANRRNSSVEKEIRTVTAANPMRRMGTTAEYGKTVAWLVSPAAAYIHGHALFFDGGEVRAAL